MADGCDARSWRGTASRATSARFGAKGAVVFPPTAQRYRDFLGYDDRWGHAHWLYQHNGGVFLPPWGKCEQWTLSVQHTDEDVDRFLANLETFAGRRPGRGVTRAGALTGDVTGIAASLGKVGLPAPVSELAARDVGRGRRRRRAQRPDRGGLPGQGREVGARARAPRAPRRRVHARAPVRRRRATRSARARTSSACSTSGSSTSSPPCDTATRSSSPTRHLVPVRGRHQLRPVPDPARTAAEHAGQRLLRRRHQGPVRLRGLLRPDAHRRCAKGARDTWVGDAPDRAELEELLGHDPEMIDALFETSIAEVIDRYMSDERLHSGPSTARASSGPGPGPTTRAPRRQAHALRGRARRRAHGLGLRRGRHGLPSPSRSPRRPVTLGAVLAAGVPVGEIRARRGRPPRGRRAHPGDGRDLQRRSEGDPRPARGERRPGVPAADRRLADDQPGDQGQLRPVPPAPTGQRCPDADWPQPRPRSPSVSRWTTPKRAFEACTRGDADPGFAELYFQTPRTTRAWPRRASTP